MSERSERALMKTRILAMNPAKWLQTATSTTELTHQIQFFWLVRFRSCFIKNAHNLASLGAAAKMKENEGDYVQAINLFLTAKMPGKAARVISDNNISQPNSLMESVAVALEDAEMNEKAGDFYERMGNRQRALDSYLKGHAYRKAVELARKNYPGQVVQLEESWGDYLLSVGQLDMAINHFMEAHAQEKAINAALKARQWNKALTLAEQLDAESARPYYAQLATHYEAAKMFKEAERCYCESGNHGKAVEMYTGCGDWERAHKVAKSFLPEVRASQQGGGPTQHTNTN